MAAVGHQENRNKEKHRKEVVIKEKSKKEFEDRQKEEIENFHNPKYDGPLQCKSYDPNPYNHMEVSFGKGE